MEALIPFFALGSIGFFIYTIIIAFIFAYFVESEYGIRSGLLILLYFILLRFISGVSVVEGLFQSPLRTILIILGYFSLGLVWSIVKWGLFVNTVAIEGKKKRLAFLKKAQNGGNCPPSLTDVDVDINTRVPKELSQEWSDKRPTPPKVIYSKSKISIWVLYWPASLLSSLLNDFIKRTVDILILKLKFIYDKITKNAFKDLD